LTTQWNNEVTMSLPTAVIHPLWVRVCHWINALAMAGMVFSGWRIYNASPLFPFTFPSSFTLGGWLGGALQWHFAMMWVLGINGLIYCTLGIVTGRFARTFFPLSVKGLLKDMALALRENCSMPISTTTTWCKNWPTCWPY
jgi:thiosulfate reductase cytochrome b subunit